MLLKLGLLALIALGLVPTLWTRVVWRLKAWRYAGQANWSDEPCRKFRFSRLRFDTGRMYHKIDSAGEVQASWWCWKG